MFRFNSLNRRPWYVLYAAGIGDAVIVGGLLYWLFA